MTRVPEAEISEMVRMYSFRDSLTVRTRRVLSRVGMYARTACAVLLLGLAFDSQGRLFVADRSNNRIQIFDQDGNYIDQWFQFSRPSGVFIDKKDMIYVADSESESVSKNHDGWKRGIRVGRVRDGVVTGFIPDPVERTTGTSAAEGVAADAQGNIYGAEVGPKRLMKYIKN